MTLNFKEDLQWAMFILFNSEINFCKRLESYVQTVFLDKICNGFESAQMLNTITDVNFGHIVSILEKVDYKNNH